MRKSRTYFNIRGTWIDYFESRVFKTFPHRDVVNKYSIEITFQALLKVSLIKLNKKGNIRGRKKNAKDMSLFTFSEITEKDAQNLSKAKYLCSKKKGLEFNVSLPRLCAMM